MSDAIKGLRDFLSVSPSVIFPEDVLGYLPPIEAERAKMRKLLRMMWLACKSKGITGGLFDHLDRNSTVAEWVYFEPLLRELGVKVDK